MVEWQEVPMVTAAMLAADVEEVHLVQVEMVRAGAAGMAVAAMEEEVQAVGKVVNMVAMMEEEVRAVGKAVAARAVASHSNTSRWGMPWTGACGMNGLAYAHIGQGRQLMVSHHLGRSRNPCKMAVKQYRRCKSARNDS